jgi:hypothetical protein
LLHRECSLFFLCAIARVDGFYVTCKYGELQNVKEMFVKGIILGASYVGMFFVRSVVLCCKDSNNCTVLFSP